jgi:isoquinoline 1-oxidoreductase beta subunit
MSIFNTATMTKNSSLGRRKFIQLTGLAGTGFLLGLRNSASGAPAVTNLGFEAEAFNLTPYVLIEKTGKITIFNTKPEIGQGTFQSIPSLICEELEIPLDKVNIVHTGGEKIFGDGQSVGGSYSVRGSYLELRRVGASAKEMLVSAAAKQWGVPVTECKAVEGTVIHVPSGKKLGYGELAEAAAKLEVPKTPILKDPKDFKLLGKPVARPDVPLKTNGKAVFGIDAEVPGMIYASIEFAPVIGAKVISVDDTASKKVAGVLRVERCQRHFGYQRYEGVAVLGENYWAALQGRRALKVKWDEKGLEGFSSASYNKHLHELAKKEGIPDREFKGDADAFTKAPVKLEAFYETPFVSHSPIEPMNCTAHWKDGELEIWVSTQVPGDLVNDVAGIYGLAPEKIKLHTAFTGGGFGRRLITDFVHPAIQLSKITGRPVKSIWTREDDTRLGPFRPLTYSQLSAGLDKNGKPVAFSHKVISPSIDATMNKDFDRSKVDGTMTEAISEQEYDFPNMRNSWVFAESQVPLLWWRAVTSTTLAFSHESFIDEMAAKAGKDPLAYRLGLVPEGSDTARILKKLKEVSGWDKALPKGKGRGVAQYKFFAGQCGQVVQVARKGEGVVIEKVWAVIDMGTVVNPDTVKGQVEGAIVMGITAAIKGGITFDKGRTVQSNFHDNPLLRIAETPKIEVHILAEGGEVIKGAGEPGLPPLAPALCNAIFAATGKRIRKLPFDLNKVG